MRMMAGNLFIILFIGIFTLFFMETTKEMSSAQSLQTVLDEAVELEQVTLHTNSLILDRDGNTVSDIFSAENRIYLPYNEIPDMFKHAFLAAEDQSFFEHPGFDMTGIARAFVVNMQHQSIEQGGSTITQQLARNLYLTHDQSYERKISELLYSYHIEQVMDKEEILELYLNSVYFSNGVYGIEAASHYYFNKTAHELNLAEIAFLSSVPNNPSHYNPLTNSDATHERKEWILTKMKEEDYISHEDFEEALDKQISLSSFEKSDEYPDYITYVYHELEQLIAKEEGYTQQLKSASNDEARQDIEIKIQERVQQLLASGITIDTALDPNVQSHAVKTINNRLSSTNIQGAVSVIDHDASEIVAITGGTSYEKFNFHRGYQAYRQPGSAIKPLLVYAPLIDTTRMSSSSLIDAGPIQRGQYEPQNFGGAVYGKVTLEEALKNSYNTAAVRILDMVGIEASFNYIDLFDFQKINSNDHVLPAALGGLSEGVSVNELTQAYTVFATDGIYTSPKAIRGVYDMDGELLYEWPRKETEVWSNETINEMRKMLGKVITEGTGRRARFSTSGYLGGKTGTTNDYYDLWFVGSSNRYTTGLWIGNDNPSSLYQQSQSHIHTQLWRDIMAGIH
jgi:penicillin-binding protein 1A